MRVAARLVVLDPDGRVLLLRYDDPPPNGPHWNTPGGGLEPGEDHPSAAARELTEETGWTDVPVGRLLGTGERVFEHGGRLVCQRERHYLVQVPDRARPLGEVATMHRSDGITGWRWWTAPELASTAETVWPLTLGQLIDAAAGTDPPAS